MNAGCCVISHASRPQVKVRAVKKLEEVRVGERRKSQRVKSNGVKSKGVKNGHRKRNTRCKK